ncbi:hypothetical protein C813_26475 [Kosakonia sacchari SP1]|nr:hypothetical protein C813_26475 [Kosakonia sacchari SP1]
MTHSELPGKIRIKLKNCADLGLCPRVSFLLLLPDGICRCTGEVDQMGWVTAPYRNVQEV